MAYRTQTKTCNSCCGAGSFQRTRWVNNPASTGPTSLPEYYRETCFVCGGTGRVTSQVYVPDSPNAQLSPGRSSAKTKTSVPPQRPTKYPIGSPERRAKNAALYTKAGALLTAFLFGLALFQAAASPLAIAIGAAVSWALVFGLLKRPLKIIPQFAAALDDWVVQLIGWSLKILKYAAVLGIVAYMAYSFLTQR